MDTSETHQPGLAGKADFAPTLWSLVVRAGRESTHGVDAFGQLVQIYWYPVYAYIRRRGNSHEPAQDLTQAFFVRLMEKHALGSADASKGRFRAFLLTALRHFLINEWRHDHAEMRGGKQHFVSWDELNADTRFDQEPATPATPESAYDRDVALALIEKTLTLLQEEQHRAERADLFEALRPYLAGGRDLPAYSTVAESLGMTPDAVKMAVMRLRRRFGEILREQVALIASAPNLVEDELRHLAAALSAPGS